jgi:hypothetical protein
MGQGAGMTLERRGRPLRRCLLQGPQHAVEVPVMGHCVRGVGAKGRLADRQRPLILFSCTFQAR